MDALGEKLWLKIDFTLCQIQGYMGLRNRIFSFKSGFCGKADEQIGYETSAYSSEEKSNDQRGMNKRNKRPLLKAAKFQKQFLFFSHFLEIN